MNSLDYLKEALSPHISPVILPGKRKVRDYFLIEMSAKTDPIRDLQLVYGRKFIKKKERLARTIVKEHKLWFAYGVFCDERMIPVFAFNRILADYNRKKQRVVLFDIDDAITNLSKLVGTFLEEKVRLDQEKLALELNDIRESLHDRVYPTDVHAVMKYSLPD